MKLKFITSYLESLAPPSYQESYDNTGLIAGNPDWEISKVLLCIDSTEEVVKEAVQKKCNLIIAHHPIIFKGIKKLTGRNYVERAVMLAIKNDIAIYCMHTNLDNAYIGVNKKICEKLGLVHTEILAPKKQLLKKLITFCPLNDAEKVRDALFAAGAGVIGDYTETSYNTEGFGTFKGSEATQPYVGEKGKRHHEKEIKIETIFQAPIEHSLVEALLEAHPYEEVAYDIIPLDNYHPRAGSGMVGELPVPADEKAFLQTVKKTFRAGCVRHTHFRGRKIQKVAVCGGSGSFLLPDAIHAEADIFITSDFKYHDFFDAEGKIIIADIGHYESEQFTTELFYEVLRKNFDNFALLFSETNTNPVNYL
ncbi:MAG TPA: Nif3-like dinuclear metal center hexameric protein [Chitinophagales bacterium]|nr:Nif3-like dinuclear metal center hexameric protein [Chitinophagales bacterium]